MIALSTQAPTVFASFRHGITTEISSSSPVGSRKLSTLETRVRAMWQPPMLRLSTPKVRYLPKSTQSKVGFEMEKSLIPFAKCGLPG